MMSSKPNSNFDESSMETVLAKDVDCKGKLKFSKKVLIKGRFEGDIETTDGSIYIGEGALVNSPSIKTGTFSNKGKVVGNVEAKVRVEQYTGSNLEGDIVTKDVYFETGSTFNGNCTMISDDNKKL